MTELGLILLMAGVTYATRIVGFLAVAWLRPTSPLIPWSDRLANLVLFIILAKILFAAPQSIWVGVVATTIFMILTSRFLLSMWLGVALVAAGRLLV